MNLRSWLPGIDTTFSILADAARRGLITYERLVAAYSERPARTYGLFPRKGSLAVVIEGSKSGRWYDHEAGVGGSHKSQVVPWRNAPPTLIGVVRR